MLLFIVSFKVKPRFCQPYWNAFLLLKERKKNDRLWKTGINYYITELMLGFSMWNTLLLDHGVIPWNLRIDFCQSHLSLHVTCEASEPAVAGDTRTLPKARNSVRTEGVVVSGCWREAKQYWTPAPFLSQPAWFLHTVYLVRQRWQHIIVSTYLSVAAYHRGVVKHIYVGSDLEKPVFLPHFEINETRKGKTNPEC